MHTRLDCMREGAMGNRYSALLAAKGKSFSRSEYKKKVDRIAQLVVSRFSRGNVAKQNGAYLTADRLEREREVRRRQIRAR